MGASAMPSPPLKLSDSEIAHVMTAAGVLPPADRDVFLQTVATVLAHQPEMGPGVVARTCRAVLLRLWRPPELDERRPHSGKYG
jgi:hypothetical protein